VRWTAVLVLAHVGGRDVIPDATPGLLEMLKDEDEYVRQAAAMALPHILQQVGRDAIPDLREMLKDSNRHGRQGVVEALQGLVTENDLAWLVEWVIHYPLAKAGELANRVLIHLDCRLYSPALSDWPVGNTEWWLGDLLFG
jgi:HEAT repeat protein